MNSFFAIGRLTKDPKKRTTQNGTSVCTFTLAVDRRYKNADGERQADFFPVVCWRHTADFAAEYLAKGKLAGVIGEMQTRSYEDKSGVKRYITECVADQVQILSPKSEGAAQTQEPEMTPANDDDLPF